VANNFSLNDWPLVSVSDNEQSDARIALSGERNGADRRLMIFDRIEPGDLHHQEVFVGRAQLASDISPADRSIWRASEIDPVMDDFNPF
jgi:hypothetical protein